MFDLSGKVAMVTGSSRGLGFTIARGLGRAGATVVLNGRNRRTLAGAAAGLAKAGVRCRVSAFDVTSARAIEKSVARTEKTAGPIDILVNNAGIQRRAPIEGMEESAWREVMDTNLTSVFLVSRAVGRRMIERRHGKIINICSLMSEVARPAIANYAAAKGGVRMLTRAMAVEWAKHNIQVNGIGPGYFKSEMTRPLYEDPKFDSWIRSRTPAARWGEPEELVGAAVFLASAASDFVSGQIIYVDGGVLASL